MSHHASVPPNALNTVYKGTTFNGFSNPSPVWFVYMLLESPRFHGAQAKQKKSVHLLAKYSARSYARKSSRNTSRSVLNSLSEFGSAPHKVPS